MPVISNHGQALYETSGFKCGPKLDFVNSYLRCSEDDFKMQVCAFTLKINRYAHDLKKSQVFIVSCQCLVEREYFFETPGM